MGTLRDRFGVWIVTTGLEYEEAISLVMSRIGYVVEKTPPSGDQGVDLVAHSGTTKIAIQCKLYTGNHVGNDAVQQVYAGMAFYGCDESWVVSNAGYTQSAKQLAKKLGVRLLHHDQLPDILPQKREPIGLWGIPAAGNGHGPRPSWLDD